MRIILVAIHPTPSPQAIPLANAFLQSYQKTNVDVDSPVEVILRDFFLCQDPDDCITGLYSMKPALIGFSMYVWNREWCRSIAAGVRRIMPEVRLFAGGPEVTADPHALLSDELFDFLITGEGEQAFADVCGSLAAGTTFCGIPGVVTREKGNFQSVSRHLLTDLDTIPSPWLTGILDARQYRGILWQLSRGCTFSCDFCFDSRGGKAVCGAFLLIVSKPSLRHFAGG